jgi:hypothetical protein
MELGVFCLRIHAYNIVRDNRLEQIMRYRAFLAVATTTKMMTRIEKEVGSLYWLHWQLLQYSKAAGRS